MKKSIGQQLKMPGGQEIKRFSLSALLPFSLLALFVFFYGCSEKQGKPITVEQVMKAEETAHLVAKLLASGRTVIEHYQDLINDPDKGYKHFTPKIFVNKTIDHFGKDTSVKLL